MAQVGACRLSFFHSHGSDSGSRLCGMSAMRAFTLANQANGSTWLSFAWQSTSSWPLPTRRHLRNRRRAMTFFPEQTCALSAPIGLYVVILYR
jgi:hypothetical protein